MPWRTSIGGMEMSRKKKKMRIMPASGMGQARENYYPGTSIRTTAPFFTMECPLCGRKCWSTNGEPIPCQRCEGTMIKEKTGA